MRAHRGDPRAARVIAVALWAGLAKRGIAIDDRDEGLER